MNRRNHSASIDAIRRTFGDVLQENVSLARYTSARIGGNVDLLLIANSAEQLAAMANTLWDSEIPFRVLGAGSNVLVADAGVRGVVILNQARAVRFWEDPEGPRVHAESGASLGSVARRVVERGWSGLEWAATVPGTVGGAIVGNAGAHGGDIAGSLAVVEILQRTNGKAEWPVSRLEYGYRDSWLKQHPGEAVVLAATLRAALSTPEKTKATMRAFLDQRQRTQPAGASMGSMFKNPPGDFAGRLIDEAGLKGYRIGGAQISPVHGNFFLNLGDATAADVLDLIQAAREKVMAQTGVELELEVELIGEWDTTTANIAKTTEGGAP
ncbi:MAG: UDP-N-acetylmuramate dehydrogenase [Anaerolineales bacterium]|nr:UDP-N-acetylmuramate dehydrogenase [Anaerolineales bacterium]